MPTTRKVSQRMIAEMANVSQSAVSLVVSGRAEANRIPAETRDRIDRVIQEVGYVPNVAARLLKAQRNGLVGVHTYERVFPVREDDYYHDFLIGIEEAAVANGVDLVLFSSTLRDDGTRAVFAGGMNRLRLADGSIFMGLAQDDDELRRLADDGYPFVFIGRRVVGDEVLPHVTADYAGGVIASVDKLRAAGHRRIVYVGAIERDQPHRERLQAYSQAMADAGLEECVVSVVADDLGDRWDEIGMLSPTALLVETLELAETVADEAARRGIDIPVDLSCVALDTPRTAGSAAAWSRMEVPKHAMGAAALRMLLESIEDSAAPRSVVVPIAPPGDATISTLAG